MLVGAPGGDSDRGGLRMAPGVRQRLADQAEDLCAAVTERNRRHVAANIEFDLAVDGLCAMQGCERLQQVAERPAFLLLQPQVVDRPAKLLTEALEAERQSARRGTLDGRCQALSLGHRERQLLERLIVKVTGDATALLIPDLSHPLLGARTLGRSAQDI